MQALYDFAARRPAPVADIPSIPEPIAHIVVGAGTMDRSWVMMVTVTGRLYALGNVFDLYTSDIPATPWPLPPPPGPVRMVFPTSRPVFVTEDGRVYTYRRRMPQDPHQLLTQWPDFYAAGGNDAALWFITEDGVLHVDRHQPDTSPQDYSNGVMQRLHLYAPRPLISATATASHVAALTVDGTMYIQRVAGIRWNARVSGFEQMPLREALGNGVFAFSDTNISVRLAGPLALPVIRAFDRDVDSRAIFVLTEDGRRLRVKQGSAPMFGNAVEDFDTAPVHYSVAAETGNIFLLESGEVLYDVPNPAVYAWDTPDGQQPVPAREIGRSREYVLVVLEDGRVFHGGTLYRNYFGLEGVEDRPGPGLRQLQ